MWCNGKYKIYIIRPRRHRCHLFKYSRRHIAIGLNLFTNSFVMRRCHYIYAITFLHLHIMFSLKQRQRNAIYTFECEGMFQMKFKETQYRLWNCMFLFRQKSAILSLVSQKIILFYKYTQTQAKCSDLCIGLVNTILFCLWYLPTMCLSNNSIYYRSIKMIIYGMYGLCTYNVR